MTKDELPSELNDLDKFLVREDEPTLEEIEALGAGWFLLPAIATPVTLRTRIYLGTAWCWIFSRSMSWQRFSMACR
jgi:hypothetical protein